MSVEDLGDIEFIGSSSEEEEIIIKRKKKKPNPIPPEPLLETEAPKKDTENFKIVNGGSTNTSHSEDEEEDDKEIQKPKPKAKQ